MKILSGTLKGRNFYMPAGIRPTQNLARKAIFDILGHDLEGIHFLELFSGSGAVGLEAASQGAASVTFVERENKCVEVIEDNLRLLGLTKELEPSDKYKVIMGDAFAAIKQMAKRGSKFDVVFADPPYDLGLAKKVLKTLEAYDIIHPGCLMVIQYSRREPLPEPEIRFKKITLRKYGVSQLAIFEG